MKKSIFNLMAFLLTGSLLGGSISVVQCDKNAYATSSIVSANADLQNTIEEEETNLDGADENLSDDAEYEWEDNNNDLDESVEENEDETEEVTETAKKTLRVNQKWTMDLWSLGNVKWKSSNKKVATVNSSGVVTAKKVGTAEISTKVENTTYICKLTVKKSNFKPVALKKLANYSSLKKNMTDKQFKKVYKKALKLVKPLGDLSRKEQLMGVAVALREMFEKGMGYSMSTPHYNDPYGYFVLKTASCAGCTRATGLCLNILGIKYEHVNENKYSHQWTRVKVGKKYWICDAYGLYCGPEPGVRKHPYF